MEHGSLDLLCVKEEPMSPADIDDDIHMFINSQDQNSAQHLNSRLNSCNNGANGPRVSNSCQGGNLNNTKYEQRHQSFCESMMKVLDEKKFQRKNIDQANQENKKFMENLCKSNVPSVTAKSTELPPFPFSLVMNHPQLRSLEVRLPLLHSTVDSNRNIIHTVIDEFDLLDKKGFTDIQTVTNLNVSVQPVSKTVFENLIVNCHGESNAPNNCTQNLSKNIISEIENSIALSFAPSKVKQAVTYLSSEIADSLYKKKANCPQEDFFTLPPGRVFLGQTSNGDWIISSQDPNKILNSLHSGQESGHLYYQNIVENPKPSFEEKDNNPTVKNLPCVENTQQSQFSTENRREKVISSGKSIFLSTNEFPCPVNTESVKENNKETLSVSGAPRFMEANAAAINNSQTRSDLTKFPDAGEIFNQEQEKLSNSPKKPVPLKMMFDGKTVRVVPKFDQTDSTLDSQSTSQHQDYQSDFIGDHQSNIQYEKQKDSMMNVKVEPVDTGYETDTTDTSLMKDTTSLTFVPLEAVPHSADHVTCQNSIKEKGTNCPKRKGERASSSSTSRAKFIKIDPVSTDHRQPKTDKTVHSSDEEENDVGDDSDSASELDDSETSRQSEPDGSFSRFPVINDEERYALIDGEGTRGTKKQTRWGVSIFRQWLKHRHYPPDFEDLPIGDLDERLEKFYAELRTADGKLYAINSFRGIRASINRHITREPYNRPFSLFTDSAFYKSNKVFKAMMHKIKMEVVKKERPPPLSPADMQKLITSDVLSINTPRGLQNKVWLDLTLNFTYKNCPKQRDYKTHMFLFKTDEDGIEYVEILDPNKSDCVSPKMYATRDIYCPVASLMKYLTKRNKISEDFFQQPRCEKTITDDIWYTSRPIGKRQLGKMMENMSIEAGLSRKYTNMELKELLLKSFYMLPVGCGFH